MPSMLRRNREDDGAEKRVVKRENREDDGADKRTTKRRKREGGSDKKRVVKRENRARVLKTVIGCLAVLAVLAVIPLFVNTAIGYIPLLFAVAVLALSFVYLLVLKHSLTFKEVGPDKACIRGEILNFALTVENHSILPAPRLEVVFFISDAFGGEGSTMRRVLTLPPRSHKTFDLGVRFDHIGKYDVGISGVTVFDPLGVFFSDRHNGELHPITIEPQLVEIDDLALSDDAIRESSQNIKAFINDGMDYSGVREYRWGDPIKSIHWKVSAKSVDTYFTRLYEMPTAPGLAVFCDLESPQTDPGKLMDIYDAVVESAFSVVKYALARGYDAEFLFVDALGAHRRFTGPLEGYRAKALEALPLIHSGNGETLRELLRQESSSIYCQHNLVVCTANADEATANSMLGIMATRHNPLLIVVDDEDEDVLPADRRARGIARRLGSAGVWAKSIKSASDLKGAA